MEHKNSFLELRLRATRNKSDHKHIVNFIEQNVNKVTPDNL